MLLGRCKDCREVQCPKDYLGLHIFYLGTDFSITPPKVFFYCKCEKKAYLV